MSQHVSHCLQCPKNTTMHTLKQGYYRIDVDCNRIYKCFKKSMHIGSREAGANYVHAVAHNVEIGILRWGNTLVIVLSQKFHLSCF